MAVDVLRDVDYNVLSDIVPEDIVLDVNSVGDYMDFTEDRDIFKQISEDLGIPLIPEDIVNKDVLHSDRNNIYSTYGIPSEFSFLENPVKLEPPSPTSSLESGETGSDSTSLLLQTSSGSENACNWDWKHPETPPLTPPEIPVSSSVSLIQVAKAEDKYVKCVQNGAKKQLAFGTQAPSIILSPITPAVTPSSKCIIPPLVLTQKEFVNLASQGLLHFGAAPVTTKQVVTPASVSPIPPKPIASLVPSAKQDTLDLKALKRQQRMIKNRESACLSRKKKKEYVQNLEMVLKEVTNENDRLKGENEQLKRRLQVVEKENVLLKQNYTLSGKKVTAVLAVTFMIALNFGPLSGIFNSSKQKSATVKTGSVARHGRSLLWTPDVIQDFAFVGNDSINHTSRSAPITSNDTLLFPNPTCPMFINKSESLRLDSELRGWIFGAEQDHQVQSKSPLLKFEKYQKSIFPMPRLKKYLDREALHHEKQKENYKLRIDSRELQIYQNVPQSYEDFLKAIKRREDMFYVVSFTGDHLLLPARTHNKTRRPLMSLLLPALPLNDSMQPPKHHIAMMQIDCEVLDTKLLHVKESFVPNQQRRGSDMTFQSVMASQTNGGIKNRILNLKGKQKKNGLTNNKNSTSKL